MKVKEIPTKFWRYLRSGGIGYAIARGIRYIVFTLRKKQYTRRLAVCSIAVGKLKVTFVDAIKLFWDGAEITEGIGLNVSMKVNGAWTNTLKSRMRLIKKDKTSCLLGIRLSSIGMEQLWKVTVIDENKVAIEINATLAKRLQIDEMRMVSLLNIRYKQWVNDYRYGDFPRLDGFWHDVYFTHECSKLVGVRFPVEGVLLPAFLLESEDASSAPVIQNPPLAVNAHIIGFKQMAVDASCQYGPGSIKVFSGSTHLFSKEEKVDEKMEALRLRLFSKEIQSITVRASAKKKKEVLLANLPWQKNGRSGVRAGSRWPHIKDNTEGDYLPFPFFLAYATALLRQHNINASIQDAIAEKIGPDEFISKVLSMNIDYLVAETSVPSFYNDMEILEKIAQGGISIILCGPHAEIYSPAFLKNHPFIDFVLIGEYEYSLLGLMCALLKDERPEKVMGLLYRFGADVIKNTAGEVCDNNGLPWPERDSLPMHAYCDAPGNIPLPSVQMLASRGCPYGCTFCLWPQVMYSDKRYRPRNVTDVVDEMEFLVGQKKFKSVYFDDDTFNIGRERMFALCGEIKKRGLQAVPWAIMARVDLMDEPLLLEMKSAGLWAVKYGIESSSGALIKDCQKSLDIQKATRMIKFTKKIGIRTHLTFAFGMDGETKESVNKTIDYALSLNPDTIQFSIVTPFPGTKLFESLQAEGRIITKNWEHYDGHNHCVFKPDRMSCEELKKAKESAYLRWQEHQRKRRGLLENCALVYTSLVNKGLSHTFKKIRGYLFSIRRKGQLSGKVSPFFRLVRYFRRGGFFRDYVLALGVYTKNHAFIGPYHVQIDLTNNCNNNCVACWCNSPLLGERMYREEKKQQLPYILVKRLLEELRAIGTKELYFSGGGEPFMHPQIMRILAYAKKKRFICYVNTNFTLFDREKISQLCDMGIDYLTVSLWAATPETYALTHPNKSCQTFSQIIENLRYLNSIKRKRPHIKLYNVIFQENYRQIENMIRLAKDTGSEAVEFTLVDTIPGKTDALLLDARQIEELRDKTARIKSATSQEGYYDGIQLIGFDAFLRRIASFYDVASATYDRSAIDTIPCYIGWYFSRITANGDVNGCLKAHRIPVGNIYRESFRKIWNGEKQSEFRRKTLAEEKQDSFFRLIGNDPDIQEAGCYKSCDDIQRNTCVHGRMKALSAFESRLLKTLASLKK